MNLLFKDKLKWLMPFFFLQMITPATSSGGEAGPASSIMDVDLVWTSYFHPGTRLGKGNEETREYKILFFQEIMTDRQTQPNKLHFQ